METKTDLTVRFWGVRGSYPTPGSSTVRYGGNTACVEIEAGGTNIILDAGTGIIPLGQSLLRRWRESRQKGNARLNVTLLFSHFHHDHTQGFPFFAPAYVPGANLNIYGPDFLGSSPLKTIKEVMQPPYFPVRMADLNANLAFSVLRETDVLLVGEKVGDVKLCAVGSAEANRTDAVRIQVVRSYAHPGGVLHFRVEWQGRSVVYASDTEGYVNGDRRLTQFAHQADLLIHDAQYTDEHYLGLLPGVSLTQGYGHSTVSMACQAARNAEVHRLVLFHHAPEYSDNQLDEIATRAQRLFPQTVMATEGMEVCLNSPNLGEDSVFVLRSGEQPTRW
jgi:phosphoribosyl 1,2-cyclic phosphodiesterase